MRYPIRFALATLVVLCSISAGHAVPPLMNYQGVLIDDSGAPITGPIDVEFRIWNDATGGDLLWSESQSITPDASGLFNVLLGSANPIPDTALMDTAAYLEMRVETDPPLSPRAPLVSAPFSFTSGALRGGGPAILEHSDPSSGASGSMEIGLEQNAATNDRVKVKFHWDSEYPSTGDSAIYDFIVTPDSIYEARHHHKPFQVTKRIDKSSPSLSELSILTANTSDTAIWTRTVDADLGIVETTTTTGASGLATGKRQHRPFRVSKEWGASNTLLSGEWSSIFDLDTGFTETAAMNKADLIAVVHKGVNQTREHILLARQVGVPGATTDQDLELQTDNDSNIVRMNSADNNTGETAGIELSIVPDAAGTSKNIRKNITVNGINNDASAHETLGLDSGLTRTISIAQGDNTLDVFQRFGVSPGPPTKSAIAIPNLLDARKSGNASSGNSSELRLVLDVDSGFVHTAGMTKADLITHLDHSTSQTREHILLARQVGVPGATDEHSLELQTNDDGSSLAMHTAKHLADQYSKSYSTSDELVDDIMTHASTSDTNGIEMIVTDTTDRIVMFSKLSTTKWEDIVLKRGIGGSALSLSHVGASAGDGIHAMSDAAAGGRLGINTNAPTEAFHLVGNGCYTGIFGACSDRRYKDNIETLAHPLDAVNKLRGVRFDWKQDEYPEQQFPSGEQIGLIAQEVEKVVPTVVNTGANGYKSVDYAKLVALLIEGMKEQQKEIEELRELVEMQSAQR